MTTETRRFSRKMSGDLESHLLDLFFRASKPTARRSLWLHRFTAAERAKFAKPGVPPEHKLDVLDMWRIARGTTLPEQAIVEIAHALGFINSARYELMLAELGLGVPSGTSRTTTTTAVPHWVEDARELRYRDRVVRVVKRPSQARNIVEILRAFEAAGWPPRIDDPLEREPNDDKRRRDICNLNKGLDTSLLRFTCDGTGTGFLWRRTPRTKAKKAAKRRR